MRLGWAGPCHGAILSRRGAEEKDCSLARFLLKCRISAMPNATCSQKLLHGGRNFYDVCLYRKMSGIEELDLCVRQVFSKRLCSRGNEKGIILAPDRKQREVRSTKIFLKFGIEPHIRRVIQKQIQLNFLVSERSNSAVSNVYHSGATMSELATPCVYCHRVPSSVKMFFRSTSRFSAVGTAQYFRIGPQASPRPSS